MTAFLRQGWVAVKLLAVMTVLLGIVYPLALFAVGRIVPDTTDGSYVTDDSGVVIGSSHIGQAFAGDRWFWPRPSVAGDGYDALSSGGSNLASDNPDLVTAVSKRKAASASVDGVDPQEVPADAVTASGSGLDPHISPEYAHQQVTRVAAARRLDPAQISALVDEVAEGRLLGFIGEPRVNVLTLNLALERLS